MVLSKYISGTIFIDDKIEDIQNLKKYFEIYNIWSKFINPMEFEEKSINYNYLGARLVFLDLQYEMSGEAEINRAVNILRILSQKGVKNFILVVWSLHNDQIDELKQCIDEKMKETRPLFILDAQKGECSNLDPEQFNERMNEIFEKNIEENPLVYSLLEWEKSTLLASRDTFNDVMSLANNNILELNRVLLQMAKTSTEGNNMKSSFKYLHDILSDNILKYGEDIIDIKLKEEAVDQELKWKLNTLQMIKKDKLDKRKPGDVYLFEIEAIEKDRLIKEIFGDVKISKENVLPIKLDITPPCTFNKSNISIFIEGIVILDYSDEIKAKLGNLKKNFLVNYYYEDEKKNALLLDFIKVRYSNKEDIHLKKIFRLGTEFRSSIQQQFGSFLTRIGDNVIKK